MAAGEVWYAPGNQINILNATALKQIPVGNNSYGVFHNSAPLADPQMNRPCGHKSPQKTKVSELSPGRRSRFLKLGRLSLSLPT